jgi:hypothetical protein
VGKIIGNGKRRKHTLLETCQRRAPDWTPKLTHAYPISAGRKDLSSDFISTLFFSTAHSLEMSPSTVAESQATNEVSLSITMGHTDSGRLS